MPQHRSTRPGQDAPTRILLVDDHPMILEGLETLLADEQDLVLCGRAASAGEALDVLAKTPCDLAIVDLTLKDSSGLDLIRDIRIRHPKVKILVLSMRDEKFYAERALRAGAGGYIHKEESPETILEGIRKVLAGEICLSRRLTGTILTKLVGGGEPAASKMESLTDRELQVFELIGRGLAMREIAQRLYISAKTVESHREHIKQKLGLSSANALLKNAIQWTQCQSV